MRREKWRLKWPACRTIADVTDSWLESAFEAHRNAIDVTARALHVQPSALRAEMDRRNLEVPRDDYHQPLLRRVDPAEAQRIHEANHGNGTDVAAAFGVSPITLRRHAARLGITLRKGRRHWSPTRESLHAMYWAEGKTLQQIGDVYGLTFSAVVQAMRKFGVPRRKSPVGQEWPVDPVATAARIKKSNDARWGRK